MKRIVFLLMILAVVSCKKKEPASDAIPETYTSGFINIASDDNFVRLINTSIDVYEAANGFKADITPIYTTETDAVRLLLEDSVRFALITRDLTPYERVKIKEKTLTARRFIIGFDGVALVTNRNNPDSIISVPTLQKILTGEITEWKQVNPNSPLGTIRVIFDNKESGIVRYAVDSICKGMTIASPNLYALGTYIDALDKAKELPNALCLMGSNFFTEEYNPLATEYEKELRLMRVSTEEPATKENSYLPYAGDLNNEKYPFWRPLCIILTDPRSGLASGFTNFLSNERGQKIILHNGLLPVSDPQNQNIRVINDYAE